MPLTPGDGRTIRSVVEAVREEVQKPKPAVDEVKEGASRLHGVALRLGQWLKQRFDQGADAFAKTLGAGIAAVLLAKLVSLYETLVGAVQAISNWIVVLAGL